MNNVILASKTSVAAFLIAIIVLTSHSSASAQHSTVMVRMAEIEIDPNYIEEYRAILKEEAEASLKLEPEVVSIFPMYQRETPTQVRILEIYASRKGYDAHLKTSHFQKYKSTTLKMVKSVRLVDMDGIDLATMNEIFRKAKQGN